MNSSQIDDAVQNVCVSIRNFTIFDVNSRMVDRFAKLYREWKDKGNVFSLLEANYLVDFYCSHIINYCDTHNKYDSSNASSPDAMHKRTRKFLWSGNQHTYEVFRQQIAYADGFLAVKKKMLMWRKQMMRALAMLCPDEVTPHINSTAYNVQLDWNTMLQRYPLQTLVDAAKTAIQDVTTYHASGWGMYRVINLNNYDASKLPSSCITNALIFLCLLYMTGFPEDNIAVYFQAPKSATCKKQSHWAVSCTNPYTHNNRDVGKLAVIGTLDTVGASALWSNKTFRSFTVDIVKYYKLACKTFQYAPGSIDGGVRVAVLRDFEWKLNAVLPPI